MGKCLSGSVELARDDHAILIGSATGSEPGDKQSAAPALDTATMYDEDFSRRIDRAFATAEGLARSALPPSQFLFQITFVIVDGIDAVAGAIWQRTNGESFELRGQHDLGDIQPERDEISRRENNELLKQVFQSRRPWLIEPRGSGKGPDGNRFQNASDCYCLLSPIMVDQGLYGLLEVWTNPDYDARIQRTYLNYCVQMTRYVGEYISQHSEGGTS